MYQAFTPAPAGTHNNAQGVSGFTRNDMAFMAAMFPAQFGHFAGNPAPSPAVTQLEQAQPIVPAVNQQTTQVLLLQVLSCVEWCNSATKEPSCALWARTSEAKPQHMVVDVDCDRTIDFPEFLQLMARKQDEDYRL